MSLLDNIPTDLSSLIEHYKHPINCHKCKKKTLTIKMCNCSPNTKCCDDCLSRCNSCDYFVSEDNKFLMDIRTILVMKDPYCVKIKIDTNYYHYPNNYYSLHSKCEYCEGLFCFKCSAKSTKICPTCISNDKYHN